MEINQPIDYDNGPLDKNPLDNELSKASVFSFTGEGGRFFGIWAVNLILTIVTLGLYYPWAKAATRKFLWNETSVKDNRFVFHGTGKEMFKGFIIAYGIILGMLGIMFIFPMGIILFYIGLLVLAPIAIFGGWKYRMSRTSYRGIYFSFNGDRGEFIKLYLKNLGLTIITFGIYASWMHTNVMKYLLGHTKLGDMEFSFKGDGATLFGINIIGILLFYPTLGIYMFWWIAKRFNFTFQNLALHHDDGVDTMKSNLTGKKVISVMFVNMLMLIFTLGLAFPWAYMRTMKLYTSNLAIPDNVNLENLVQDADNYKDATGDDLLDVLDIGLEF